MQLILPSLQYEQSVLEAVQEIYMTGDSTFWADFGNPRTVTEFIEIDKKRSQGIDLPNGWVPATTYWLIDNNEFIGYTNIRHTLNNHLRREGGHIGYMIRPSKREQGYGKVILRLALQKAKEMGIDPVLITCDETNIASRKIIESNGGIFEKEEDMGPERPKKLLFWVYQ